MSVGERRETPGVSSRHASARVRGRLPAPPLSATAWAATAATAAFIALSCWWLSRDRAMPYGDAAEHLEVAVRFHEYLSAGHWLMPFTYDSVYAPLTPLVGALGIFAGGRTVAAPILAENLVYVPLLALGCYWTAQRAYGSPAGALAVVFALGSPLMAEQYNVLMLDAPLAALVAATVALVLASDRFQRTGIAGAAGAVAGLGLLAKQSFPLYVTGLLIVVVARGGWRNRRGLATFFAVAFAVSAPWFLLQLDNVDTFLAVAGEGDTVPPLARPPLISIANMQWYFWATVNGLLFVPLLAFATVGVATATVDTARRGNRGSAVDVLAGGALAWLAITVTPHHDVRYTMPLIVFLAVLGTGWIVRLPRAPRIIAATALLLAVAATTLGATFGVGPKPEPAPLLPGNRFAERGEGVPAFGHWTFYSNRDFLVSGPRNGGDILGLLKEMHADGIRDVIWPQGTAPLWYPDFNHNGLLPLLHLAELSLPAGRATGGDTIDATKLEHRQATIFPAGSFGGTRPCVRLGEGQGLWIRRGALTDDTPFYCPRFRPRYYGP